MRTIKRFLVFILIIQIFSNIGLASDFKAEQPILITSAGQSADVLMVKILAQKANLQFTFDKLAQADSLKNHASLIIVSGGSTKGLGAAKIDKQQELDRVQAVIKAAKEVKMNIITMHLGGKARRGKLSDEFNSLAAGSADCIIVVKSGDDDQFFSKIAKDKKIPIFLVDKIIEAGNILKNIYEVQAK